MVFVETNHAPKPAGHYTQAVVHNGLVFVSGQLGFKPESTDRQPGTIEEQTRQALKNVCAIVEAAGSRKDLIVKMTVYISDISLWARVNEVYASFFGSHKPARAIVPVNPLHYGYAIEIEAVAAMP